MYTYQNSFTTLSRIILLALALAFTAQTINAQKAPAEANGTVFLGNTHQLATSEN